MTRKSGKTSLLNGFKKNNANCSSVQLSILHSSKAALMGTADSIALSATLDAIMEKRMANNPEALNRYYRPEVQGPGRSKTETAAAGPDSGAAKPAGSGGAPPSVAAVGAVLAPTPGMLPGASGGGGGGVGGGGAPANQNININLGGANRLKRTCREKCHSPTSPCLFSRQTSVHRCSITLAKFEGNLRALFSWRL